MIHNSLILLIETGTDVCSVGLAKNGELVALRESAEGRDHARLAAVYVDDVLKECGVKPAELSAVAVGKGPGSYTGLRIGVSLAKGLCYGLGIPLIGISSLESLCANAQAALPPLGAACDLHCKSEKTIFVPMVDARRMEVYTQIFDSACKPLTAPEALIIDQDSLAEFRDKGREVFIFGSGAQKCREALSWAQFLDIQPSARGMVRLATDAYEAKKRENVAYFEPFYLKDFVITTTKKKLFQDGLPAE